MSMLMKNEDISKSKRDMKKLKLGFCRADSGLFLRVKILVNRCWLNMWKFRPKLKKKTKKSEKLHAGDKSPGGIFNIMFRYMIFAPKQLQGMCFHPAWTIWSYQENWWNLDFLKIGWKMGFWPIFLLWPLSQENVLFLRDTFHALKNP